MKVALPGDGRYNIDARTTYGSINTDVPITVIRKTGQHAHRYDRGGGCRMDLTTSNGSISLTKD